MVNRRLVRKLYNARVLPQRIRNALHDVRRCRPQVSLHRRQPAAEALAEGRCRWRRPYLACRRTGRLSLLAYPDFDEHVFADIFESTGGVPRRVNQLANRLLLLGAVALALLLWMQRGWWLLCPIAVLAMSFGLQSAALERQAGPAGASAAGVLVVGTANLAVGTTDFGALLGWLQSADAPDVLFLQEFTDAAQHALTVPGVAQRYPYRVEAPQPDPFGLAVLSRLPLSDVQRLTPASALATLRLRATLTLPDGHAVRLAAVHPMPPLNAAYARARDDALAEEARHLAQPGALGLMGGDFNTTPWARGMFAVQGQLRRSGAVPSWPNAWGWLSVLPLDHVLATSGWQLVESRPGPNVGSDHRPVVVRLRFANKA